MAFVDWIKIEHTTPDKQEVYQMADTLGIDPDAVSGKLLRIWIWADQNTADGQVFVRNLSVLDRVTHCAGFGEAMVKVGWLRMRNESYEFSNFTRHNTESAKKRAKNVKDKRSSRGKCQDDVREMSDRDTDISLTPSSSSSTSLSSLDSSSEEGGVGETSKPEDFVGPISARSEEVFPDPLADFDGKTPSQARHFWGLFCEQYHGRTMLRNLHTEATHKELRHFAKAIHTHGEKAIKVLTDYYTSPPREDKALNAYQIVYKLGLNASVETAPPWEISKKKEEKDGKERMFEFIKTLGLPKG